jgi:hypothetical protein
MTEKNTKTDGGSDTGGNLTDGGEGGDTPKAAAARRNPPKPAMHLRSGAAKLDAGARVAKAWADLCQNEPLMVELLLPEELRKALGDLAREHAK